MRHRFRLAFTLPEVMISMVIFSFVTSMILVLYHSVTVAYRHNFVRLENSDRAREVIRRVVPLISSACPQGVGSAIYYPDTVNVASRVVVLSATRKFVETFIYDGPGTVAPYVPFRPSAGEFGRYQVYFRVDAARSATDPSRRVGDVWIAPYNDAVAFPPPIPATPGNEHRCVARNIYDLTFENAGSNKVLLTVEVYGQDRTAINRVALQRLTYRTEIWLPFYSNTTGNS